LVSAAATTRGWCGIALARLASEDGSGLHARYKPNAPSAHRSRIGGGASGGASGVDAREPFVRCQPNAGLRVRWPSLAAALGGAVPLSNCCGIQLTHP
jgi:hypothetical protein